MPEAKGHGHMTVGLISYKVAPRRVMECIEKYEGLFVNGTRWQDSYLGRLTGHTMPRARWMISRYADVIVKRLFEEDEEMASFFLGLYSHEVVDVLGLAHVLGYKMTLDGDSEYVRDRLGFEVPRDFERLLEIDLPESLGKKLVLDGSVERSINLERETFWDFLWKGITRNVDRAIKATVAYYEEGDWETIVWKNVLDTIKASALSFFYIESMMRTGFNFRRGDINFHDILLRKGVVASELDIPEVKEQTKRVAKEIIRIGYEYGLDPKLSDVIVDKNDEERMRGRPIILIDLKEGRPEILLEKNPYDSQHKCINVLTSMNDLGWSIDLLLDMLEAHWGVPELVKSNLNPSSEGWSHWLEKVQDSALPSTINTTNDLLSKGIILNVGSPLPKDAEMKLKKLQEEREEWSKLYNKFPSELKPY